jgi:ABC-type multidrug transport system fused ATPase/permease subunit
VKAKYINKLERVEQSRPINKKQRWDLSSLTDEELSTLEAAHTKKSFSREEESQLNAIMSKVPGWDN